MFSRGQLATLWWEGALVTDMRQRNPGPAGTLKYKPPFIVPTLEGLRLAVIHHFIQLASRDALAR
jgi:hypothetical protein